MLQDGNAKTTKQYNEIKMIKERPDVGLVMAFVMSTLYCHRISGFDTITGKHGYGYTDMENTGTGTRIWKTRVWKTRVWKDTLGVRFRISPITQPFFIQFLSNSHIM